MLDRELSVQRTKHSLIQVLFYFYVTLLPLRRIIAKILYVNLMGRVIAFYDILLFIMFLNYLLLFMTMSRSIKSHKFDKYMLLLFLINFAFFVKGTLNGNNNAFSDLRAISLLLLLYYPATLIFKEVSDVYNFMVFIFYYAGFVVVLALMERFGIGSEFFIALASVEDARYGGGNAAEFGTEMYRTGTTVGYALAGSAVVYGCLFFLDKTSFQKYFPFKPMWTIVFSLNIVMLVLTKIKGYLMLPFNLLLVLVIIKLFSPVKSQLRVKNICSLFIVFIVFIGVVAFALPKDSQFFVDRFKEFYYTYGSSKESSSLSLRKYYAEADYQSFKSSPFFGNGLGYRNFVYIPERNTYYMATGEVGIPFTLAMVGIVGYVSINGILLWFGWHSFKIFKKSSNIVEGYISASYIHGSILRALQGHIWNEDGTFFLVMTIVFLRIFSVKQTEGYLH